MCIPCKIAVIDLLFGKNEAKMESSARQFYGVTLGINLAALGFSICVSDLALILGLNGAIVTNTVAFLLPIAFYLRVKAKPHPGYALPPVAIMSRENIRYHAIFVFGVLSLCLGSWQVAQSFTK